MDEEKQELQLEDTDFFLFVKKFCEEHGQPYEHRHSIRHGNKLPFDSIDRLIALYIIEKYPQLLETDLLVIKTERQAFEWYDKLPAEFKIWFHVASMWSYDNYEREMISDAVGLYYIIREAKKGTEHVLKDSYYDGGWFGAS